jgi:hypothetical protein
LITSVTPIYGESIFQVALIWKKGVLLLLVAVIVVPVPVLAHVGAEDAGIISLFEAGMETAFFVNSKNEINTTRWKGVLNEGTPVVVYGNNTNQFKMVHNSSLTLTGDTDNTTNIVAVGVWLQGSGEQKVEHCIIVKDYEFTTTNLQAVYKWLNETMDYGDSSLILAGTRTEVEYQEPYGVLESRVELLKVDDTSDEYDWYDVTVNQELTPGSNSSGSDWEWNWLTYTMNGSMIESNVFLSDYDQPHTDELPTGLFSFLWRALNFNLKRLLPWFYVPEVGVEGVDMSDFNRELFMVQYRIPDGFQLSDEPLSVRHHYVLRVEEGEPPRFWQGTQVKYMRGSVIAGVPYFSPLMGEGYLELR